MTNQIKPKDHAEEIALFRAQILGPVLRRELARGELLAELRELSTMYFRPPDSDCTRSYALPTLLRWRRAYLKDGLRGLLPKSRKIGEALALTDVQRELLLEIRRQHPAAPASVILDTLVGDGRLEKGEVSAQTLRRFFRRHSLARTTRSKANRPTGERRRWEAGYVGELWHADVCHGKSLRIDGKKVPVRIHALLDDKSRFILGMRVVDNEREVEMLNMLTEALRHHGLAKTLYLDNGPTYSGKALETVCGRLGIQLMHARPYDPQARGKMERFWRTLREGCLDHLGELNSLHDVQMRVSAFVAERYHKNAHASLMGGSPAKAWDQSKLKRVAEDDFHHALTMNATRIIRNDCTLSVGGIDWEISEAFLAGRKVHVYRSLAAPQDAPWVVHDEKTYLLTPVSPVANGKLRKRRKKTPGIDAVDFDPPGVLLDRMLRRAPRYQGDK